MAGTPHLTKRSISALAAFATVALAGSVTMAVTASVSHAAPNCTNGYVALTFDDGPGSSTNALLSALKAAGVRATLFNIGNNVQNNRALAQAQAAAGMWIGNHSWSHGHMTQMNSSQMTTDLRQTQQAIQSATGTAPKIFRPPYGETNGTLQSAASQLGLKQVTWDVDSQDWNGASTASIVQAASRLQPGGVILMHDNYQTTRSAIPQIVNNLNSRGLCPGMISPSTGRAVAPDGGGNPTTPPSTTDPTNPPAGGACTATYQETQRWGDRFNGEVTIKSGSSAISSWTATVRFQSPQTVPTTWNGTASWDSSRTVMTMKPNGNGSLPAGGSTTFGFTVMANGNWAAPSVSCTTP